MRMEISLKKKVMFYKFTFYYLYFTILLFLKYKIDRFVNCTIKRFFKIDNRKINDSVILNTHKEVFVTYCSINLYIYYLRLIV